MSWVLVVVGAIVGLLVVVFAVGASLYAFHRAISTAHFRAKPEAIWALVSDLPNYPSWRTNLRAVERGPDHRGHPVWVEVTKRGMRLPLAIEESVAPRRLVLRIADPKLPFGGAWTIEIQPKDGGGSIVQATEDGTVKNPIFRFLAKFVFGHHASLNSYLRMLGRKLGEPVTLVQR